jgi:hypothetical protein
MNTAQHFAEQGLRAHPLLNLATLLQHLRNANYVAVNERPIIADLLAELEAH